MQSFKLSDKFLSKYKDTQPNWGYGEFSYFIYKRTYSRTKEDGTKEEFYDTVKRCVEGCFDIQLEHCKKMHLPWDAYKAQMSAQKMFQKMWEFKFLPPGRGLWTMGTPVVKKLGSAALQNCGFISTESIDKDFAEPFAWACDMLMLGVGIGYDTKGAGKVVIKDTLKTASNGVSIYKIPDTREGWVESIRLLLNGYSTGEYWMFDYSDIRPAGMPINGFGGTSSGPGPLKEGHDNLRKLLDSYAYAGKVLDSVGITDIMNYIGKFVVAGNVRRSAEIAIGNIEDTEFIQMKDYNLHPDELKDRRWMCIDGESIIDTSIGLRTIKELTQLYFTGTKFNINLNGLMYPIGGIKQTETKDTLTIKTQAGPSLVTSYDHRIMTVEGWKRADELEIGDILKISDNATTAINRHSEDYKEGYLIGHLIGDGTFTSTTTTGSDIARLQVYTKDAGYESVKEYIEQIFFTKFNTRKDFSGFSGPNLSSEGDGEWYFISCKEFTDLAKKYGIVKGNKTITKEILASSYDFMLGLVTALIDTDGWVVKDRKTFAIEMADEKLLNNLQLILLRLGFPSRINQVKDTRTCTIHGKQYVCGPAWRLTISGYDNAKRLVDISPLKNNIKLETFINLLAPSKTQKFFGYAVISIENSGKKDLYDINVPDVNAFTANGLWIHNSNNSVVATASSDFSKVVPNIAVNGEPGLIFLDTARSYGRFKDGRRDSNHHKYDMCDGFNPCAEQSLRSYELCCLVETFPANHDTPEEYFDTLKYAYLYAKSVTLISTHCEKTNQIMLQNRRIGCSQSGIQQAIKKFGIQKYLTEFCDKGYKVIDNWDHIYSRWLGIPTSIKMTTVKPSGTVSILAGATPGVHCTHSEFYYRTVRVSKNSEYIPALKKSGYIIEDSVTDPTTYVVYFPIKEKNYTKSKYDISLWEQLTLVKELQYYWSDNAVSCTITFNKNEAKDLHSAIAYFSPYVKTLSFLPLEDHNYEQAPYQTITEKTYLDYSSSLSPLDLNSSIEASIGEKYCNNDSCTIT